MQSVLESVEFQNLVNILKNSEAILDRMGYEKLQEKLEIFKKFFNQAGVKY